MRGTSSVPANHVEALVGQAALHMGAAEDAAGPVVAESALNRTGARTQPPPQRVKSRCMLHGSGMELQQHCPGAAGRPENGLPSAMRAASN